jgi:hypothetical protein
MIGRGGSEEQTQKPQSNLSITSEFSCNLSLFTNQTLQSPVRLGCQYANAW